MKNLVRLFMALSLNLFVVSTANALSFQDLTSYQKQKYWSVMADDCIPLLNNQKYSDYRICALNTLQKASQLQESTAWCNDSDGGVNYLKKGTVKTDLNPNGLDDYVYDFGDGKTYLIEGAC